MVRRAHEQFVAGITAECKRVLASHLATATSAFAFSAPPPPSPAALAVGPAAYCDATSPTTLQPLVY